DSGNVFEKTTTGSLTISRNTRKKMAALQVSTSSKEVTDLSINGTSNCYIIPSGGSFKIKADVKGNSDEPLSGTPVTAEVLWESFNNDTAPEVGDIVKNVRLSSGYILFDATGLAGNALVSVKDEGGNILWSWHLWSTDYNPDLHYDVYSPSKAEMMNRNLGALSNTPGDARANGLLYQWGRKDPFLGSSSTNQSVLCASAPDGVANQMVSKTTEHGTIAYTTAHPTCFIDTNIKNWMVSPDYSLWASEKTIYDPCPVGWKVPPASIYESWQNPFSCGPDGDFAPACPYRDPGRRRSPVGSTAGPLRTRVQKES
ncbi:MAG: hypothetical protein IKH11_08985, partial [Bacteroidales bacterium]|nr:hypothetical protein [Bacteroidales bacterium]